MKPGPIAAILRAAGLAAVLVSGSLLPSKAHSVEDLLGCNRSHTENRYNDLHRLIRKSTNIALVYNLARTSLCLGKREEGMGHMQRASDSGHIAATQTLGMYYRFSKSFNSSKGTSDIQELNNAIHYYEKAAQMILSTPNYPDGATKDMKFIESKSFTSYSIFKSIPLDYFGLYSIAIGNILRAKENVTYFDTLKALSAIADSASRCLNRPAFDVWGEKKNAIFANQQIKCGALRDFARVAYPLEQRRAKIAQSCTAPLNKCSEHQDIVEQIRRLAKKMYTRHDSGPRY